MDNTTTTKPVQLTFKAFNKDADTKSRGGQFVLDGRFRYWDEVGVIYMDFDGADYIWHIDFVSDRISFYDVDEALWLHPASVSHKIIEQIWIG